MFASSLTRIHSCLRIVFLSVLLLLACRGAVHGQQQLDLNRNGTSDIWESVYQTEGLDLDVDSDGDGVINRLEATGGTDPRDPASAAKIAGYRMITNGLQASFEVRMSAVRGKRFELQASDGMHRSDATNWVTEASVVSRTHSAVVLSIPADRPTKICRMSVSDVDIDGDGLSDWEEYLLGLDPLLATSNGQLDPYGVQMNDYRYITNRLTTHSLQTLLGGPLALLRSQNEPLCGPAFAFSVAAAPLPTGTGLTGEYYTNASSIYTNLVNLNPTNLFLTTNDPVVDFEWGPATVPNLSNGFYSVRWTGQVEPSQVL